LPSDLTGRFGRIASNTPQQQLPVKADKMDRAAQAPAVTLRMAVITTT
jgi:hypothetical protein